MKELQFLGRGSAFNVKEGNNSAFIKSDDDTQMLLIDCGGTVFSQLLKLNVLDGVEELHILITHLHADHVGSLADLLFYMIYRTSIKFDIIVGSENIAIHLIELLSIHGLEQRHFTGTDIRNDKNTAQYAEIKILNVFDDPLDLGFLKINNLCKNNHSIECYSYELLFPQKQIGKFCNKYIYTSDTKDIMPICELRNGGLSYALLRIYIDASYTNDPDYPHCDIKDIHQIAQHYGLHNIIRLMHIDSDEVLKVAEEFNLKPVEVISETKKEINDFSNIVDIINTIEKYYYSEMNSNPLANIAMCDFIDAYDNNIIQVLDHVEYSDYFNHKIDLISTIMGCKICKSVIGRLSTNDSENYVNDTNYYTAVSDLKEISKIITEIQYHNMNSKINDGNRDILLINHLIFKFLKSTREILMKYTDKSID